MSICREFRVNSLCSWSLLWIRQKHIKPTEQYKQVMKRKWKSLSCVLTLHDCMDYHIVHGILQARILEWAAFPFSRGSSQPGDQTQSPTLQADSLPAEPQGKPINRLCTLYWVTNDLQWVCWRGQSKGNLCGHDRVREELWSWVFWETEGKQYVKAISCFSPISDSLWSLGWFTS